MNKVKINIPLSEDLLEEFDDTLKDSKWSNRSQAIRSLIENWIRKIKPKKEYESNRDTKDIKTGDAVNSINCPSCINLDGYKIGMCRKFIHEDYWGVDICLFKYIEENKKYILFSRGEIKNKDLENLISKLSSKEL